MVLSKQDILTQIGTLLADNSTRAITPQRLRDVLANIVDNAFDNTKSIEFIEASMLHLATITIGQTVWAYNNGGSIIKQFLDGNTPQNFWINGKQYLDYKCAHGDTWLLHRYSSNEY
jgi:hypothetical protein